MSSGRPRATGLNGRVVVIALNAGCTVAMYPGPKRPPTETAQIAASGESSVRNIDGTDLPVASRFTVLPGLHTISAGSGALPGGAWLWTPLQAGDEAGFGLGAELALKYDQASGDGYKVSLRRFPVAITAHTFLHMTDRWWMVLPGGVEKELGLRLSVSPDDDPGGHIPTTGTLGGLGEGGMYYITYLGAQRTAIMLAFRYTSASDSSPWGSLNAHSFGLVFTIHYNL